MKKCFLLCGLILFVAVSAQAQQVLPGITVKNISGKIIVSWKNEYALPVTTLNIQRSYDSLKNYTTIGSVLNPQSNENGYADPNPPYNKMYYRVFIAFEGGAYIISQPVRPSKDAESASDSTQTTRYPWQVNPQADSNLVVPPTAPGIVYPSKRIFTSRDNSIVIHLPDALFKKYTVKFFDDQERMVFELNKLNEEYLILEKVNFGRSGWYRFELYDGLNVVEKNKFFVPRDGKNANPELQRKPGR